MSRLPHVPLIICLLNVACSDPSRLEIERLLAKGAVRPEVENKLAPTLGKGHWYAPGDAELTAFLAREPRERLKPLHDAVRAERGVLYYTTMWQMTWLFFDEQDRLVGFMLAAQ